MEGDRILARNGAFLVSNEHGDIPKQKNQEGYGFYFRDTRFLDELVFFLPDVPLQVLSRSEWETDRDCLYFTNRRTRIGGKELPAQSVLVKRERLLSLDFEERIVIENHSPCEMAITCVWEAGSSFSDIFEVRGMLSGRKPSRQVRGTKLNPELTRNSITLGRVGMDGCTRSTLISFDPAPESLAEEGTAVYEILLPSGGSASIRVRITPMVRERSLSPVPRVPYNVRGGVRFFTDHPLLSQALKSGIEGLKGLLMEEPQGPIPQAGLPWFGCPFGRDSLLTAYQALVWEPEIAEGVLRYLASHQGMRDDPRTGEGPGKIPHELRDGEMARTGEVPFRRNYATVDASLLFLVLLAEYVGWTGNEGLLLELLPCAERILAWIQDSTAAGKDRLLEYVPTGGLGNLGWKDSADSIIGRDGTPAPPPIALPEVQGYLHDAFVRMAGLYRFMKKPEKEQEMKIRAEQVEARFDETFWLEDLRFYALARDGRGRRCRPIATNCGHGLWSGVIPRARAGHVVHRLMQPDIFSGWGLRCLSSGEKGYHPFSYHKGSVWPHDTMLIAAGMKRYGFSNAASLLIESLLQASARFPQGQLPELFAGIQRADPDPPVPILRACRLQAWSLAIPVFMVQTLLGLAPRGIGEGLRIAPHFFPGLSRVRIENLRVGKSRFHLEVTLDRSGYHWFKEHLDGDDLEIEWAQQREATLRRS
ncbi:MAG: amylo-alpha-1,6-glucosidase [Armatimonadetes bacterium]|nr:amylo-alpha-1,6-glucosidase [Armatimonadota bacterium]